MTKKEAIENHRKMWNWIADETEKKKKLVFKHDYFRTIGLDLDEVPPNNCFCCGYVFRKYSACSRGCPIKWRETPDDESIICMSNGSPYFSWFHSLNWEEAAKYAREIANLPEREDV